MTTGLSVAAGDFRSPTSIGRPTTGGRPIGTWGYLLDLLYTTASIVDDTPPDVLPVSGPTSQLWISPLAGRPSVAVCFVALARVGVRARTCFHVNARWWSASELALLPGRGRLVHGRPRGDMSRRRVFERDQSLGGLAEARTFLGRRARVG